ncbi:MAG TPA: ferrochelatase [Prolixibacteraceae bacterium]|jgi:ferrochelatase
MTSQKNAVLLINVGTPDSPSVKDVRKYLFKFLNDPRVIDIPWLLRKILVNLIIVPFRAPKSAKLYKLLWNKNGSPLLFHGNNVKEQLQKQLGDDYTIFMAMRYGNPHIRDVMSIIKSGSYSKLIVLPLFPHYAASSSGTAIEFVMNKLKNWEVVPEVKFIGQFYNNPLFLEAFRERIESYHPENFDHVVFSYHGLPLSHINRIHPEHDCESCTCDKKFPDYGEFCYKATCYETTRLLAAKLGLPDGKFSQSFQSRLSKNWLKPFTDKQLIKMGNEGIKRILVVAPAFVADCLETSVEIGIDYKNLFKQSGGEELVYVESLNALPTWIKTLKSLVEKA